MDWFLLLPLVLLGLWSFPKEDTGFSISKAVFSSPLTVPGEFLKGDEALSSWFLQKMEQAVSSGSTSPRSLPGAGMVAEICPYSGWRHNGRGIC